MPATRTSVPLNAPPTAPAAAVPPLMDGERLSREEFVRRYEAMPPGFKAELIEGVVYVASPLSNEFHGAPNARIDHWLGAYWEETEGTDFGVNSTVRFDTDDEPQPDAHLRILPECGGRAAQDAAGFLTAAPELVVEIAATSAGRDLGPRKRLFLRKGVREYLVWRVRDRAVDWFVADGGEFVPLPLEDGTYRSRTFPGLWMEPAAFIGDVRRRLLAALRAGLASAEHADFVRRLEAARMAAGGPDPSP